MSRQQRKQGRVRARPVLIAAAAAVFGVGLLARVLAVDEHASDTALRGGAGPLPVSALEVHYQDSYTETVAFTGRVRAPAVSRLGFEQPGRVVAIPVREGDRFEKGAVLARLDDARLAAEKRAAAAELARAEAERDLAARTDERVRALFKDGHVSRQRLDDAESRRKTAEAAVALARARLREIEVALAQTRIVAPFSGIVSRRLVDEGTVVAAGTPVLAVLAGAETGEAEALVGLPEAEAGALQLGRRYPLRLEDGREVEAELAGLVPQLEGGSRAMIARLVLPRGVTPPDGSLASLLVTRRIRARGFWLPLDALTADLRGLWRVYALEEDAERGWPYARVHFENVQVLHTAGERVYATGTVPDGARVIATGLHRVVPGMLVVVEGLPEHGDRPGDAPARASSIGGRAP